MMSTPDSNALLTCLGAPILDANRGLAQLATVLHMPRTLTPNHQTRPDKGHVHDRNAGSVKLVHRELRRHADGADEELRAHPSPSGSGRRLGVGLRVQGLGGVQRAACPLHSARELNRLETLES